jgi:hypothetical protein
MIVPCVCKHCDKEFSFKQSMYRHMKYTCKKNKDIAKNNVKDEGDEVKDHLVRLIIKEHKKREELLKQIDQLNELIDHLKT